MAVNAGVRRIARRPRRTSRTASDAHESLGQLLLANLRSRFVAKCAATISGGPNLTSA
jgi:hypothetical protein